MKRLKPIHIAFVLIAFFISIERLLRQGKNARSLEEGATDKGSTRSVGLTFGTSLLILLAAPFLNKWRVGRLWSERFAWGGIAAMLAGLSFRVWASRALGAYYTRTLRTEQEQHLITEGPYRLVRNPGYLGVILLWLGAGISTTNGIALAAISVPVIRAYLRRMEAEEIMLADALPDEYPAYASRTRRLIPFIY